MNPIPIKYRAVVNKITVAAAFCITGIMIMAVTMIVLHSWFGRIISSDSAVEVFSKLTMMAYSFFVILALSKGKISLYGFRWAYNVQWKRIIALGLVFGMIVGLLRS